MIRTLLIALFLSAFAPGAGAQVATQPATSITTLPDAPSAGRSTPRASAPTQMKGTLRRDAGSDSITAKLTLLSSISSKSPSGSSFLARVGAPVAVDGRPVLPDGTLVEGHLQTAPARRLMRGGALRMVFDRIKLPDGTIQNANFYLVTTNSDAVKVDSEGMAHPAVSKKRLALQLGGTAAVAKLADDLAEEILAAGAGSARFYGLGGAAVFLAIQKGREVKLKEGDVIEVGFERMGSDADQLSPRLEDGTNTPK